MLRKRNCSWRRKNVRYSRRQSPNNRAHPRGGFHVVGIHEQQPHFNNRGGRVRGDRYWTPTAVPALQIRQGSIQSHQSRALDDLLRSTSNPQRMTISSRPLHASSKPKTFDGILCLLQSFQTI